MNSLSIKINIKELTNYSTPSRNRVNDKTLLLIIKSFSEYVKRLYLSMIKEAIHSKRYKGQWEPIEDEGYKEYLGVEPTGDIFQYMVESFEVVKIGYNFIIRVDPKKKYPGSDLSLERVVLAIDNGTSKFHSRPILRKIIREIDSHMTDLYRGFLKMRGVI